MSKTHASSKRPVKFLHEKSHGGSYSLSEAKRASSRRRPRNSRVSGFPQQPSSAFSVSGSPFSVARTRAMAGQEDVEIVRMRYETTSAFTSTAGAASYLSIKGNSIYRPYGSNTDSCAGYQRLYTQYERSVVLGSRVEVRLWSNTSAGVQQPFRVAIVPCTSTQLSTYTGFANIASLRGVPHAQEVLFSPGAELPTLRSSGSTAQVLLGQSKETGYEVMNGTVYSGVSGADPSTLWYHLIGLQAMAGTTSLDSQMQVMIEFEVMFHRPIPTAVQSLNLHGNEEVPPAKSEGELKESKKEPILVRRVEQTAGLLTKTDSPASLPQEQEYEFVELRKMLRPTLQRQPGAGC